MADTGAKMDYPAHSNTYARFIGFAKTGALVCAIIAFVVVLIISR